MSEKTVLRKKYLNLRNLMSQKDVEQKSLKIINILLNTKFYKQAKQIFTYVNKGNEVNTKLLISNALRDNKLVAVPKVIDKGVMKFFYIDDLSDLDIGYYGILEPKQSKNEADEKLKNTLIIIPALVVDYEKNRIGYGGGFYDRYLSKINNKNICKVALIYSYQIEQLLKIEEHDTRFDYFITENKMY